MTFALVAAAVLAGCASTDQSGEMPKAAVLDAVQGQTPTVFPQALPQVQAAAVRALTSIGCEIEVRQTFHFSGYRPRKFGLVLGGGGEHVEIYLLPGDSTGTRVWVETDRLFVGIAYQKNWDKQVMAQMTNLLKK